MDKRIGIISGGFDPIHVGHVRMIKEAMKQCDSLIVIVNNDIWLKKKKGYVFMPEDERIEIIHAMVRDTDRVIATFHKEGFTDRSVCEELRFLRTQFPCDYLIFMNGGDRHPDQDAVPEVKVCQELDIVMFYNIGGEKIQSSSDLVRRRNEHK